MIDKEDITVSIDKYSLLYAIKILIKSYLDDGSRSVKEASKLKALIGRLNAIHLKEEVGCMARNDFVTILKKEHRLLLTVKDLTFLYLASGLRSVDVASRIRKALVHLTIADQGKVETL